MREQDAFKFPCILLLAATFEKYKKKDLKLKDILFIFDLIVIEI